MRTKFEMKQVFKSPGFIVIMAYAMFLAFFALITDRDPDGRPTYPLTISMISDLKEIFAIIPMIIVIIYAGEAVWRERDRKVNQIIDAAPFPNWAYTVPKTAAVALVLCSVFLVSVLAAIAIQLSLGFTQLELGGYFLWYVLPLSYDMLLVTALAVFVQALSPHKYIGWGIMVLFVLLKLSGAGPDHNLLNYGGTPPVPVSDMNGMASLSEGPWAFIGEPLPSCCWFSPTSFGGAEPRSG
jgi:ABC-type transport system involved in multi-copper enzyme maturation permease subunit